MSELAYRNYLFSNGEFMVLSALSGIEDIHILADGKIRQLDERELDLVLFQLYQREILCWGNANAYILKPEVRLLFQNIKNAKRELRIYAENGSQLLCFLGDMAVITELSGTDKNTIKMHGLQGNELFAELYDRGILPVENMQSVDYFAEGGNSEVCGSFLRSHPDLIKNGLVQCGLLQKCLQENQELLAFLVIENRERGQSQEVILIFNQGIFDYLVYIKEKDIRIEYYTIKMLKNFLKWQLNT